MFNYLEFIEEHNREYGSCPFWSWNDKLEEEELKRQIDDMKQSGMKGFFMHARGGLQTEYFSDEWFRMIQICVDYAKEQGMQAWLYDENGWPSGFADRKLLEDSRNWSSYLKMERCKEYPDIVMSDSYTEGVIAVYDMSSGKPVRLTVANNSQEYLCISRHFEKSYVDTLNPNMSNMFLECVYEEYIKRFPDDLGMEHMPGFFTDEPQYFRYATPWSNVIPHSFMKKYGYDVFHVLPALFIDYEGACEKRYDYWCLLHELFTQNWIRPVYEWCEKHQCKLTGHAIEESALFTQMWCCGGVMPFYEYEHIPGVDHLGQRVDTGLEAKQVGSVAAQLGKKRVLAEIYGCSGCDTTPRDLKSITDSMYVDGVNLICQHLYPYSSRGERKYDHPLHFAELLPWNNHMGQMNDYYNKLGCLLSLGEDDTNILVLHPMHSAYLYYRREDDRNSVATLETSFLSNLSQLWSEQILFHLGDETLMKKYASVEGRQLIIGKCRYDVVIIPDMDTIDASTVRLLEEYLKNGGRLLCMGRTPKYMDGRPTDLQYTSNINFYELKSQQVVQVEYHGADSNMLKYAVRRHGSHRIMFVTNLTDKQMFGITVSGLQIPHQLELSDMSMTALATDGTKFVLDLAPHESCVILDGPFESVQRTQSKEQRQIIPMNENYRLEEPIENYWVLDYARVSMDGITYSDKKPIPLISQELLEKRHKGNVWLQFEYHVSGNPEQLYLVVEPQKYREVAVNGATLQKAEDMWRIDRRFYMYKVKQKTKLGVNTVDICFDYFQNEDIYRIYFGNGTESLRNCMSFDTEISPIYLVGDFELQSMHGDFMREEEAFCHEGDFSLKRQENTINASNLTLQGYPFFYGKLKLGQTFTATKQVCAVRVEGSYTVCEVWINGSYAGSCFFDAEVDISRHVIDGENEMMLVLYSSPRNLIGPFHYKKAEPASVFPQMFKFENLWQDGCCTSYRKRYAFVPFGIQAYLLEE